MNTSITSHFTQSVSKRSWRTILTETIRKFSPGVLSIVLIVVLTAGPALAGWYNAGWKYRKCITIDHTRISNTSQIDFPVLVNRATDADLAARALASGNDILFTAADGTTKLAYERDLYVSATGALVAWVKVPTLDVSSDTVLYLYYGNAAAVDQQERANVWDSGYKAVWHLKENATGTEFSETLRPNAAGDETGITSQNPSGTAHWDKVDEATADNATTYVYTTSTTSQNDLYNVANTAVGQGIIKDVTVYFCFARNASSGTAYARPTIKTHSAVYSGAEVSRTSSTYATFTYTWTNNPNTGIAWTWDEINSLQAGASIRMSSASYNCRLTQVYVIVKGSPYLYQDSTANAKVAAPINAPVQTVGKLDGALSFNGAASSRYADATNSPTPVLDNWTLQAWINPAALPQGDASAATLALFNGSGSGGYGFGIGNGSGASGSKLQGLYGNAVWHDSGYTFPVASAWYHVAMVRSAGNLSYYVNGTQTANTSALTPSAVANNFTIGSQLSSTHVASRFFNGIIDEARISDTARNADWLKTEFANQSNPSSFYIVSGQQATNGTVTVLGSSVNPVGAGESVAFTVTVSPVYLTTTPSGSVTFYDGAVAVVTLPLSGGQATLNTNLMAVGSHAITAVYNGDASFSGSTSTVLTQTVTVGAFNRLLVLVPGETAVPGTPTGKTGTPLPQTAGVAFNVTVYAVDAGWYLVNTVTDRVSIVTSDPNADLPAAGALVAGTRIFNVRLNMAGSWTVTATDDTDGTKTPSTSSLITVGAPVIQQFFLPMPEAQIMTAFNTIRSDSITPMVSVFSIVVTMPGTSITYDEWEDGYEAEIDSPANSSTKIWGDGKNANGICPGFANDPLGLVAGTVITLRNNIPIPRVQANQFYDGGDRIGATRPVTVTRACWADNQGPVRAVAVEVPGSLSHGKNFIAPVGENVSANDMFSYVGLMVMADEDNTQVIIDRDGTGGVAPTTTTIARGYAGALQVNGGISKGATVTSNKPIQVHLITGDPSGNLESRSFVLRPTELWSDQYIIPVGTENATYPCRAFLFNPNSTALTVSYTNQTSGGILTVPANNGVLSYTLPSKSGTLLRSADGRPFYVVCTMNDVVSGSDNDNFDWGFAPLPIEGLTTEAVCGWGPGSSTMPPTQNGSPVFVTSFAATTVYIDYNGDRIGSLTDPAGGKYDAAINLAALQSAKIYDPDNDQTGMRLYTLNGVVIAAAWGEDPSQASTASPFLDMGYCLVPFPKVILSKTSTLVTDVQPSGLSLDDIMEYTLRVDNRSLMALGNIVLWDALPPQVIYVPNSTYLVTNSVTLAGFSVHDNVVGTPFPLDSPGYPTPVTPRGQSLIFTFKCRIDGSGNIINIGHFEDLVASNAFVVVTPVTIRGAVLVDEDGNGIRDGGEDDGLPNVMIVLMNSNNVAVATTYSDSVGAFEFSTNNVPGLQAGTYTLVETDPAGYLSTGPTNNKITVTVAAGQTSNTNFFMDASPVYTLSKKRVTPADRPAVAGEPVVFTLSVANTGNVALDPIALEDTYDPTLLSFVSASPNASTATAGLLKWANVGLLAAGDSTVITTSFTVVQGIIPGVTTNRVTSTAYLPMGIFVGAHTNQATIQVAAPACAITKAVAFPIGRPAAIGETNIFTITVRNNGDYPLSTVPVQDTFNATMLTFISATPPENSQSGNFLTWTNVGPLNPSESTVITSRFAVVSAGLGTNIVVTAPTTEDNVPVPPVTNSVPHEAVEPSVQVWKHLISPAGRPAAIGEEVRFMITVTNTSLAPIYTVPLEDNYNANLLTFVSAVPMPTVTATGLLAWDNVGPLAPDAYTTIMVSFTAITNGTGRNYAISLTTTNDVPHVNVNPRVSVVKSVTFPIGRPTAVGETNSFTITVSNKGDTVLDTVPVVDTYNATLLSFVSATPTPSTHVGNILTWNNVGPLATNGAASVATIEVKFEALAPGAGTNWVVTTPTTLNGIPVPPMTNSVPHSNAGAKRVVSKQIVAPIGRAAAIGEQIQFSINVANSGDVPIFNVPLMDTYDTNLLSFVNATPVGFTATSGHVSWADVGPLGVGSNVTAQLWFKAITNGIGRNYAISLTTTNDIPHTNVNPRVSVVKDITFPMDRPTAVGETNTFTITVANKGDTALDTVPVVDTYNASLLSFVSATPAPSTHVGNILTWNNVGSLATNGTASVATIEVKFEALSPGAGTNWVVTTPTTINGVPVPPMTNSVPHSNAGAKRLVSKQIVSPLGRAAAIGEQIQFSINVANSGDVPIFNVPLTDAYDTNLLSFVNATPVGYTTSAGHVSWADVGPLGVGSNVTAQLWFKAITNGIGRNYAISLTTTNDIPHTNVNPRVSVVKTVTFPTGRPTAVGETNIFTITVSNKGDTVLDTVPVVDTYNATLLSFVSATPAPNTHVGNILTWNNVGPLATNGTASTTTILVKFEALAPGAGTNWVVTTPTTINGVPVPPMTNSVPHSNAGAKRIVSKQIVSPTGRAAAIGEQIQFSINVANSGDVPIFNVPLTDAYDTNLLSFVNATPVGYTTSAGHVSWADVGPLGVGSNVTAQLWFTAITNGIGRNYAISLTTTNDIPHTNVNPRVSISKSVVAPMGYAAQMNEQIVFQIAVTNRGDIALDVVPVYDLYLPHFLTYVSSVPASDDNLNDGALRWSNVGPLAPGAVTNLFVTFIARAGTAANGEVNTVVTTPTTRSGVPVLPMTTRAIYRIDESIDVDNVSTGAFKLTPTGTVSHTVLAGSTNRVLVVGVSVNNTPELPGVVTNVCYGGVPLTLAGSRANVDIIASIWVMINPPEGTADVEVQCSKWPGEGFVVGVITLRNVDQINPYGAFSSNVGEAGNPTISGMSSALGEVIVDTVALQGTDLTVVDNGQVERWVRSSTPIRLNPPRHYATGGGSTRAGAASVDMSWTVNHVVSSNWAMGALAFRPHKTRAISQTALVSSLNPSEPGQNVTYTATVTGAMPSPTSTGGVQFRIGGFDIGGPVALIAGVATLEVSGLTEGVYGITAEYLGDTAFEGSSSAISQQVQGVLVAPPLVITAIRIENEHAVVEWPGNNAWFYTVEVAPSLSPLVPWSDLLPHVDILGINGLMSITDTNKLSGACFYRVKMHQ